MNNYGAANKYQFDDPNKWVTVADVPLLDEHEMTNDNGEPVAYVDRQALEEIAANNNKKVYETGDPATLILGHTSDDPRAEEKPAQGFVVNYKVKPFKRTKDGQIIYAIHGDYKLRPNKAHLVEEYPRRSVELWWHKKDIDPIAMLGGSSPERDLGVVLRHSKFNHVTMNVNSMPGSTVRGSDGLGNSREGVIQFSRHGAYSIETYSIDDTNPTYKYSKRRYSANCSKSNMNNKPNKYSEGEEEDEEDNDQYSPEDLARMNAARKKRDKEVADKQKQQQSNKEELEGRRSRRTLPPFQNSRNGMNKPNKNQRYTSPYQYGRNDAHNNGSIPAERKPTKYAEIETDDEGMEHNGHTGSMPAKPHPRRRHEIEEVDEGPNEYEDDNNGEEMPIDIRDGGGPSRYDEQDMGDSTHDFDGGDESIPDEDDDNGESDPVLAKVFQSKQWNEMASGIDQIKQMLSGLMGAEQQEQQQMSSPDGGGMGGEEMPPPSTGQQPAMGQPQPGEMEEEEPEEDERRMHGEKPVQMSAGGTPNSTGMPGPSNGYIPQFATNKSKKSLTHKMSRGSNMPTVQRRTQEDKRDRIIRDLRIQLSRMKAEADIKQLENEGVMFGPTPEIANKIKYQRQEELTLAYLHDEDSGDEGQPDTYVRDKIEEMRTCYSRRRPDPVRRGTPNVASVSRYSRSQADIAGEPIPENNDDDFEDKLGATGSFEAINEFANLQVNGKSRQDAIKFCRKKYGIR